MHVKFDHSSFSRSGDMVVAHQNLNTSRDSVEISSRFLAQEHWSSCAIVWRYSRDPTFSRFGTVSACVRQTDGQTERHSTTAYTALA